MKDKVAIVTGGGSGIGQAITKTFSERGARVVIFGLSAEAAEETLTQVREAGGSVRNRVCDVSNQQNVVGAVSSVIEEFGSVDILVNNAGIGHIGSVETTTEEDLDRLYAVNVKGVYNCLHACVPQMVKQGGGAILNLASIASKVGLADRFGYSMTKGAVLTMTYSVAIDYVSQNIRCNCVCPGRVHTAFVDSYLEKNFPGKEQEVFKTLAAYQPIGRMGKPEEVAALAAFLCSDEASFITGSAYDIDGGVTNIR